MNNEKHYCHISVKGLALAGAIICSVYLFLLALFAGWGMKFMWVSKELVGLLNTIYPGYVVGLSGAVLGLLYGLVCGATCGGLVAWFHNKLCGSKS